MYVGKFQVMQIFFYSVYSKWLSNFAILIGLPAPYRISPSTLSSSLAGYTIIQLYVTKPQAAFETYDPECHIVSEVILEILCYGSNV